MGDIYINAFDEPKKPVTKGLENVDLDAPLTGAEVAHLLKKDMAGEIQFTPTTDEYRSYLDFHKKESSDIFSSIAEGFGGVMSQLGAAGAQVISHPADSAVKLVPSVAEAFLQGTRNLYGMVAQSQDPDSVLFKFKDALAGSYSDEGYRQFLEAREFNKYSQKLATGEETILINKDFLNHEITQAASYIADPTLFIPFGTFASAGARAFGMGETMVKLGARTQALKAGVMGGAIKYAGNSIEFLGDVTRGSIDRVAKFGGDVVEFTTGIEAKELRATARLAGLGGSVADALGGHIPVVSQVSNAYVAGRMAQGVGSALGAVGEQYIKQGGKRGFNSFAREALNQVPNLSPHAKNLLKFLDKVDPLLSYSTDIFSGAMHGGIIGGGLGYLTAGEEGFGQGIGAGMALGGVGALAGRGFADITKGTEMARNEVQGMFVVESMKQTKHKNLNAVETMLVHAEIAGGARGRAEALQVIAGLDVVAPDVSLIVGNSPKIIAELKARGFDAQGRKLGKDGNPLTTEPQHIFGAEGLTLISEMNNGSKETSVFINTDGILDKGVFHHEIFHAVFKNTVMEGKFKDMLKTITLGKYDAQGNKVSEAQVGSGTMRKLFERYYEKHPDKIDVKAFDEALAEYQKTGGKGMSENNARLIDDITEEFGAYYFTQFMKGKSLDYLFRGGDLGGVRGMFENMQNGFLDFWQKTITNYNPEFKFDGSIDKAFGEGGTRVRVSAADLMMRDLIRANANVKKGKGTQMLIDVRKMSPEDRTSFFNGRGADGLRFTHDKDGNPIDEATEKKLRKEWGKSIKGALGELPKEDLGGLDINPTNGDISGRFNDKVVDHLVKKGLLSEEQGKRILQAQETVANKSLSNIWDIEYHGESQETSVEGNTRRLRGSEVPVTKRKVIVFDTKMTIKNNGEVTFNARVLDKDVLDMRSNREYAKPEVKALFTSREQFDSMFLDYINNANKSDAEGRVKTEILLETGDGNGAKRRDVMHQVAGIPIGTKTKRTLGYANEPTTAIPRGTERVIHNLRLDLMSNVKAESNTRIEYNDANAHDFISRNFKVSDMKVEETANGKVYEHGLGYKAVIGEDKLVSTYDDSGKLIGKFKDTTEAEVAMQSHYNKYQEKLPSVLDKQVNAQTKHQANFKIIDPATRAEAERTGDIFTTQWGKDFTAGTKVIPQTREEFILSNMVKLRQAKPEVIRELMEAKYQEIEALRKRHSEIVMYGGEFDRLNKITGDKTSPKHKVLEKEVDLILQKLRKLSVIDFAVRADRATNANGRHILQVFNNLRENGGTYMEIATGLFADGYDKQFKTGQAVTTVATHGTNSDVLLKSMEFDSKFLGELGRHGSKEDSVGAFLSGSTSTSYVYGLDRGVVRQVRSLVKMENPYVVDMKYKTYDSDAYKKIFTTAKKGGHDGVVIQNVYDGGGASDTVFVPFSEKLKDNTAIIDTVKTTERAYEEADAGTSKADNVIPAERPSTGRGTEILSGIKQGSFKVSETIERILDPEEATKLIRQVAESHPAYIAAQKAGNLVVGNEILEQIKKQVIITHAPDTAGIDNVYDMNGKLLFEGQGGVGYSLIDQLNRAWASMGMSTSDGSLAGMINASFDANGKGYLVLIRSPHIKIRGSLNGAEGFVKTVRNMHQSKLFTDDQFKKILIDTFNATHSEDVLDAKGKKTYDKKTGKKITKKVKNQSVSIGDANTPLSEMLNKLTELTTTADKMSFEERRYLSENISSGLAKQLGQRISPEQMKKVTDAVPSYAETNSFKEGKFTIKDFSPAVFSGFADPITKGSKIGDVYAVLEFNSRVEPVASSHRAYDGAIKQVNGESPKLHILDKPVDVRSIVKSTITKSEITKKNPTGEVDIPKDIPTNLLGNKTGQRNIPYSKNRAHKVSEQVKKGVSSIDSTIADINKRSVVPAGILSALDDFKEALRKQDATDEIVVKDVEETHTALMDAIDKEMSSSSEATLPDLRIMKKKVQAVDRGLKKNQSRVSDNAKKAYQSNMDEGADIEAEQIKADKKKKANIKAHQDDMAEGADIESQQAIRAKNEVESDLETGADIESEQAFDKTQERVAQHEADMAEGVDIESEQAFDAREQAQAEAERQSETQAQPQPSAQTNPQPQAQPVPEVAGKSQGYGWRSWSPEKSPNGSVWRNAVDYVIIQSGSKLKVYNPQKALLGIYTDLEQAKRRVQREEPKKR